MTAMRGIAKGWGYDVTDTDVLDAYAAVMAAAGGASIDENVVTADVRKLTAACGAGGDFVLTVLTMQLTD